MPKIVGKCRWFGARPCRAPAARQRPPMRDLAPPSRLLRLVPSWGGAPWPSGGAPARPPFSFAYEEQRRRPPTCNLVCRDSGPVRPHHGLCGRGGVEVAAAPSPSHSAVTVPVRTVRAPTGSPPSQRKFLCPARARAAVQAARGETRCLACHWREGRGGVGGGGEAAAWS